MMGSAATMLLGMAPANTAPAAQGETPVGEGTDFLAALVASLSGAAAKSGTALAAAQLTTGQGSDGARIEGARLDDAGLDEDMPLELAAMIAGLLPGTAATPQNTPTLEHGSEVEGQLTGGDAAAGKEATNLLDLLKQRTVATLKDAKLASPTTDVAEQPITAMPGAVDADALQATLVQAQAATGPGTRAGEATTTMPLAAAVPTDLAPDTPSSPNSNFASTLSTLNASASTQQAASTQLPTHLQSAVGSARWADEVGQRVVLMSVRGQQEGSLNLTPEHLGPLEVRISVHQNTANVWFGAQHADTRAALAEAMPRLREMMADAGLMLGHAGVSQEAPRQEARDAEASRIAGLQGAEDIGVETLSQPATRHLALGLVDTYA
jgi:flagellar hook-length control protein FliK